MPKASTKTPKATNSSASTVLRAFRFDTALSKQFDGDCDRHLRNPKVVLEALIHHWLTCSGKQRDAIAAHYQKLQRVKQLS